MAPTTSSASKLAYSTTAPTGNQLTERRHGCVGRTEQPRNGRWRILLDDSFQITTLTNDCPRDDWHSVAVYSGEANDVEKYLISSFPVRVREGKWEIVEKLPVNKFGRTKIDASIAELKEERWMLKELLG
jgi:hypothetical protein